MKTANFLTNNTSLFLKIIPIISNLCYKVDLGSNLAEKVGKTSETFHGKPQENNLFLNPADKSEILGHLTSSFEDKKSVLDHFNTKMKSKSN